MSATVGIAKPLGLNHRQPVLDGQRLDRRVGDLLPAAARAIGLRHDADDVVAASESALKRRHRKLRRAEEHDAQRVTICRRATAS